MNKKIALITAVVCLIILQAAKADRPMYMLTKSTATYTELTNPTEINFDGNTNSPLTWDFSSAGKNSRFALNIFNEGFANLRLFKAGVSNVLEIGGGYLEYFNTSSNQIYYVNAFGLQGSDGLKDRGTTNNVLSPITYEITGNAPNRILKIQWKNAGTSVNASDEVNLQMWFYESENDGVEIHYGKCSITNAATTNLTIGVGTKHKFSTIVIENDYLTNGPSNPDIINTTSTTSSYTGVPANGTVYKFSKNLTGISELKNKLPGVKIYPNPCEGIFTVELVSQSANSNRTVIEISSITGKSIYETMLPKNNKIIIDLSSFPKGLYVVKLTNEKGETSIDRVFN